MKKRLHQQPQEKIVAVGAIFSPPLCLAQLKTVPVPAMKIFVHIFSEHPVLGASWS